jgi:tetratricopeptide (TPR) repeat protein
MKSTTMSVIRWAAVVGLVFACGVLAARGAMAQTHNTVSFGHADQQSSPSGRSSEPAVVTPELLADMMMVHGQYEDAIANYGQATRLDHKFAAPYINLGTVYFHENDNKRAKQLYKKSIKLDAATAPFWSNLGAVYMAERKYSDGAEAYEKAFLLDPDIFQDIALNGIRQFESPQELAKIYLTFAEIYAHAGMKVEAMLYLHKALQEGFNDIQQLQQDQQLAVLRGTPEFDQIVAGGHKQ